MTGDERPGIPVAVVIPVLGKRLLSPGAGGPQPYPVPGIHFVPDGGMFRQTLDSVELQTVDAGGGIHVALDDDGAERHGAGATRGRALRVALVNLADRYGDEHPHGTFVSFVDDDDLWYPHHLETHYRLLTEGDGADVAYSWFDGNDPFPMHRGRQWDPKDPHHITTTITVRASFAERIVDVFDSPDMHKEWSGEDWRAIMKLNELGARFVGTGEVTWVYRVHNGNTSGLSTKGDAL